MSKNGQFLNPPTLSNDYVIFEWSLSWSPFNRHENCNEDGWECDNSGLLVDVMSLWANKYNFTWDLYNDLDGDWGLKPVSGNDFQTCFALIAIV